MCSRDLKDWQRLGDRKPFLDSSKLGSGAYDLACVLPPSFPVVRGDELWFYYTGGMNYGLALNKGVASDAFAVCLAVLRRDGFISLDAGDTPGTVTTPPFTMPEGALLVNVDAYGGELRAEVLTDGGEVLAVSEAISGDHPRAELRWKDGALDTLRGKEVRLRFTLKKGSFYAWWFGDE